MNTAALKTALLERKYDDKLLDIYLDESLIDYQVKRYIQAIEQFENMYGEGDAMVFSVPGRSEVGGNHTDHQFGEVIACSINLDIIAIVRKAENVSMYSKGHDVRFTIDDLSIKEEEKGTSEALVRGVVGRLAQLGYHIGGFNAYMTSDVLVGSGMSSSAAYEVMIGKVISALYNNDAINPIELAKVSQYAENVYFGKPCGLMDQMACAVGNLIHIDFKDNSNPIVEKVDVDFSKYNHSLCLVDTKGSHANLTGEYAAIPSEMKSVAEYFGKKVLREVTYQQIVENIDILREKCGDRAVLRAIHIMQENQRVEKEVKSLCAGNFCEFLKTVEASGNSSYKYLQNVFCANDVAHQAVSLGIAISENLLGEHGVVRVHGGGFAGTIQVFVENEYVAKYKEGIEQVFGKDCCHTLKVRKYGALTVID